MNTNTDIRIDGKIKGVLHCDAKVVIGQSGVIEGDIYCEEAACEGRIIGRLEVKGLLLLKKDAVIDGDVHYKRLIVEEGASIHGKLIMSGGTTKSIQDHSKNKSKVIGASQTA